MAASSSRGGRALDRPGYFIAPTVVAGLPENSRLVQEEPFGPALPILAYDDEAEALARANATSFGLSGSVWGPDVSHAAQLAARLEVGTAWVNQHLALDPFVPFGGAKQSGLGREFSSLGLKSYMEATALHVPAAT
ncbi:aldehyde dehydrogenase family protein [Variovorax saccharolyticus]|uniref:aldehyde dehydrogenase family protein n=1 Tax=Variovorax saccharolyticus TaxID=3053516 RepID=UPI003369FDB4